MSKGDKIVITYLAGDKAAVTEVLAERNGSKVEVQDARPADPFIRVVELDKNGNEVRTIRFAKAAVLALAEVPKR